MYIHVNHLCYMNLCAYIYMCICAHNDLPLCQSGVNMVYLRECAATS